MRQYWTFVLSIIALSVIFLMFLTGRPFAPTVLTEIWRAIPKAQSAENGRPGCKWFTRTELNEEGQVTVKPAAAAVPKAAGPIAASVPEALPSAPKR